MKFACKCLNFLIEVRGDVEPVEESRKLKLSSRANKTEDLVQVTCDSVVKKVDILIGTISYDGWTEYYCRNCGVWMYCSRSQEDRNVPAILNNSTQVADADIENRKKDSKFSRIFKILIFNFTDMSGFPGVPTAEDLENLHHLAASWLHYEAAMVDNLIHKFSNEQYAELENKRLRAFCEEAALKRAILSDKRKTLPPLKYKQTRRAEAKVPQPAREGTSRSRNVDDLEFDESVMFESNSNESVSSEVSDDEREVSDSPTPRRYSDPMLARSLPIPVPLDEFVFDDRLDDSPDTPEDIGENIRALARSIRGELIFGELPPPRFNKN